jgi:hypothetical protein
VAAKLALLAELSDRLPKEFAAAGDDVVTV